MDKNKKFEDLLKPFNLDNLYEEIQQKHKKNMGHWIVEENGDLVHLKNDYYIQKHNLPDPHWIRHMMEKNWVDYTFFYAYFEACRNAGINQITIDL